HPAPASPPPPSIAASPPSTVNYRHPAVSPSLAQRAPLLVVVVGDRGRDVLAAAPLTAKALAVAENRRLLGATELAALRAARHREDAGDRGDLDAVELRAAERAARFLPPSDRMRRRF